VHGGSSEGACLFYVGGFFLSKLTAKVYVVCARR